MNESPAVLLHDKPSQRLLIIIGLLWLLLAAALIVTQLSRPATIHIDWETETEIDTAGFNVYRSETAAGEYVRLNDALIPSTGSAVSGATYRFTDRDVEPGRTYYYRLEDVELDNSSQLHEPRRSTATRVSWWVPVIAALSIFCGLFLIVRGLRNQL